MHTLSKKKNAAPPISNSVQIKSTIPVIISVNAAEISKNRTDRVTLQTLHPPTSINSTNIMSAIPRFLTR